MRKARTLLLAVLVILIVTTVSGCGSLSQYFGGKWVAQVNGDKITQDDYNKRLTETEKYYQQQGMDFTTGQGIQMLSSVKGQVVSDLITEKLIMQEATKENLVATDAQVNSELDSIKKQFPDNSKYQDSLKSQGMTETDLKDYIKVELSSKALYDKVTAGTTVTETDALNYYNANKSKYAQPEEVKARHILLKTKAEAEAVIKELKAGANFTQLAKEKSIEPGAKDSGGELGYFTRGQMVPEFEQAAFAQKVGTYSQVPVKTQFGYHVILVEDHKPAVQQTFDQVKSQIMQQLPQTQKDAAFQQYLDQLKKNAKIVYAPEFSYLANQSGVNSPVTP
ncbi:MAG: SurA N-terminal domain-containing protein [Peptococcaceae bacterium]|nr:SurA N-terminal domain-containing protein [Peptococcaceae bacterium]